MTLPFKPYIATAPQYQGSQAVAEIQQKYGLETIYKLSANESPLGPSPRVVAALQSLLTELNDYPDFTDDALRVALAEHFGLSPRQFITGNGASDVLMLIAHCFLSPEDEYIIARPTFPMYENINRKTGATAVYADLDPLDFSYNMANIVAAITPRTRLIYLCSPNNPTGNIISAEQMAWLMVHVPEEVVIISDEVYYQFVTSADFPDSLAYVAQGRNLILLHSFSKAYGLAGARVGYAITTPELAEYVSRFRQPYHLNRLSLMAAITALQEQAHLAETVAMTLTGKQWLSAQLTTMSIKQWPSEANFILFQPATDPVQVSEHLLSRGVMVRPMTAFYLPTHMRVSVGLPQANERFISALQEL